LRVFGFAGGMTAIFDVCLPTLFLFRHGETAWSVSGQHTGRTDIELTERGEDMARELAPIVAAARFSQVWTSPRERARRTCMLATNGRDAVVEPGLAEWDYGQYEGMLTSQIWTAVPDWNLFRDGCPGGENLTHVVSRADQLLVRLRRMKGRIALFSHGQFGCILAARWAGLPGEAGEHFTLDPASVSVLGPKPGHPDVPVISQWNIVAGGLTTITTFEK
jgi:broad specificity phosphatase PhoE